MHSAGRPLHVFSAVRCASTVGNNYSTQCEAVI